ARHRVLRSLPTRRSSDLALLLRTLGRIWPGRHELGGQALGDCWPHPDAPGGWLPFHKLSQWMCYSLLEPLEDAGLRITGLDELTDRKSTRLNSSHVKISY